MEFDGAALRDALTACRDLHALNDHGYLDELRARHAHLKRYLTRFLALPFKGQPGAEPLLAALKMAQSVATGELAQLPDDAPSRFVPGAWRGATRSSIGCENPSAMPGTARPKERPISSRPSFTVGLSRAGAPAPGA